MIYVSSDWHGVSLASIQKLLDQAGFGEDDFLFVLGDVIDRGRHGIELLKWLMLQPNVELLLGNHEAMLLSCDFLFEEITEESLSRFDSQKMQLLFTWQSNGAEATMKALSAETPEMSADILDYLRDAPLFEAVEAGGKEFLLVHAGLGDYKEDQPLEDYTPDQLFFTRPTLDTVYSQSFMTILGHTPTDFYGKQYEGKMIKTETWCDIDTGAAGGGTPMLLCLDTMREYYVKDES